MTYFKFSINGVKFNSDFVAHGVPIVNVNLKGQFSIGKKFTTHSGKHFNMIGRQQPCYFIVGNGGRLTIGNNVGISCTAIVCWSAITIEDNVRIGGGVVIYDTDFHSLDIHERLAEPEVTANIATRPVTVKRNAFIGAHSVILKGVTIGYNSVIGAGSVVTRSVPDNQIWAGNPARLIRNL
ncbi:DapH/DapD/GlmU-related protein [Dyadobacter sp. 50-39]|uniref:acyltransferase n=1 Tax=Dyadobacter sp. 50-39 TaxID=1895756 RepID=UPI0025C1237F|nr:acyltransferase [Dyadobacter sp. 50-39]